MKRQRALPAGAHAGRPLVAIVGRPNVGKSTLFNRLAGKHVAIVEDVPGVTRDRHYADAFAHGKEYVLIDTGGFDPLSNDPMKAGIAHQVELALAECDLVVCVVDATTEPLPADREAIALLRRSSRPVIYVANKADSQKKDLLASTYYELGVELVLPISALHGRGIGPVEEAIANAIPDSAPLDPSGDEELAWIPRVAIVGRPNAGKSSLLNRWLREERQLVDARPGTTIDSIDTLYRDEHGELVLIDTAGMRRKRAVAKDVEGLSVLAAIRSMERSHVVVLMIDAQAGVAEQDAKIAGLAEARGRALVIGLNKADQLDRDEQKKAIRRTREILAFASWAPIIVTSAKTGRGTAKLLQAVRAAEQEHRKRIPTGQVNRFFEEVLENHPPPAYRNRPVRLYFVTQARVAPPTLIIVTNAPDGIHFSYQRYVINQLRDRFGFEGTPIRVRYRARTQRQQD